MAKRSAPRRSPAQIVGLLDHEMQRPRVAAIDLLAERGHEALLSPDGKPVEVDDGRHVALGDELADDVLALSLIGTSARSPPKITAGKPAPWPSCAERRPHHTPV
jgi:hypothetical protein